MSKPGIIFMGTPQFAVPSLEILIRNGYPVKAVVTAVDKPAGRGLKMRESAVKQVAVLNKIPVLQPVNLKDEGFVRKLSEISAELFVVVAFRMLPEKVWSIPPLGTINLHASLLPMYRGAAPINHAIINGDKITGVTTFVIEKEIDKGNILLQEKTEIADDETAGSLHDKLMDLGADLLLKTVGALAGNNIVPVPQDEMTLPEYLPPASKISKDDCRIDWSEDSDRIYNFIRGLSPYPAAWTTLDSGGKIINIKILEAGKLTSTHSLTPGTVTYTNGDLMIAAGNGSVRVMHIQAEGRRAMSTTDFMRGFRLSENSICR
ncbi:MAG: methionyl-tRNA formyltransferase [Bacteroidales bacterium]